MPDQPGSNGYAGLRAAAPNSLTEERSLVRDEAVSVEDLRSQRKLYYIFINEFVKAFVVW